MSWTAKADDVFEMTSAAARRDTRTALSQLQKLVDGGTAPEGILPVLAWQIRTLIQVRDLLDQRISEGRMAEKAGMSDFVVRKSIGPARQFTMKKLLEIHGQLLQLDHAVDGPGRRRNVSRRPGSRYVQITMPCIGIAKAPTSSVGAFSISGVIMRLRG